MAQPGPAVPPERPGAPRVARCRRLHRLSAPIREQSEENLSGPFGKTANELRPGGGLHLANALARHTDAHADLVQRHSVAFRQVEHAAHVGVDVPRLNVLGVVQLEVTRWLDLEVQVVPAGNVGTRAYAAFALGSGARARDELRKQEGANPKNVLRLALEL